MSGSADVSVVPSKINRIIDSQQILTYYQPILNAIDGTLYGYEALSRIPVNSPYHPAASLFAAARTVCRQSELELLCIKKA